MKDEIKEILDKLKSNNYPFGIATIDINKLEDYITNLQEENERLSLELNKNMIERNNYLSRNEKAIEYIKDRLEEGCLDKLNYYDLHKIENILQGEDKDE